MVGRDIAEDSGRFTEWMGMHCRQNPISIGRTCENQQLAFVSNVKRIQTQNFARTLDLFTDRYRGFVKADSDTMILSPINFIYLNVS